MRLQEREGLAELHDPAPIVATVLLALGMSMISLPFKLLLFVMLDGWTRLVHGLVLSYR
ncbi:type III secretory pathway component EscR [Variovorax boronicumulans]|nr:type III secretory pathway component EscR [Variovorax boronicumulans]MDQ0608539.1 type III secretory pathway component EscR [Variovorax sp. W1I1]